ncbi:hypothetical protein D3C87_1233960 [compost metagenome]
MFGNQSQVNVERFVDLRQRQHEVAAGQWPVSLGLFVAGTRLLDQLVAVQHVHIELQQVGCEYSQQLLMLARCKTKAKPERAVGLGCRDAFEIDRTELVGIARGADVAQLQVALFVEQYR